MLGEIASTLVDDDHARSSNAHESTSGSRYSEFKNSESQCLDILRFGACLVFTDNFMSLKLVLPPFSAEINGSGRL